MDFVVRLADLTFVDQQSLILLYYLADLAIVDQTSLILLYCLADLAIFDKKYVENA